MQTKIKIIFSILLIAIGLQLANCQSTSYSFNYVWLCDGGDSSFYRVYLDRPGDTSVIYGNYRANGSNYIPTGTITLGVCATTAAAIDSSFQLIPFEMCDYTNNDPVSFIRVFKYKVSNGTSSRVLVGDFNPLTNAAYTVGANYKEGVCYSIAIDTGQKLTHIIARDTGRIDYNYGVLVANTGSDSTGYVLINNIDTAFIAPGKSWFCDNVYLQSKFKNYYCPKLIYNPNSSIFQITIRKK